MDKKEKKNKYKYERRIWYSKVRIELDEILQYYFNNGDSELKQKKLLHCSISCLEIGSTSIKNLVLKFGTGQSITQVQSLNKNLKGTQLFSE